MQSGYLEENDLFTHSCSAFLHKATPKGAASVGGITQGITQRKDLGTGVKRCLQGDAAGQKPRWAGGGHGQMCTGRSSQACEFLVGF